MSGDRTFSPTPCANPACERRDIRALGRCQACYAFFRRHGRDVRPEEMRLRSQRAAHCRTCGAPTVRARGRCATCYQYWWRTGRERMLSPRREGLCLVCNERPIYRARRCRSCYAYRQWRGQDRRTRDGEG